MARKHRRLGLVQTMRVRSSKASTKTDRELFEDGADTIDALIEALTVSREYVEDHSLNTTLTSAQSRDAAAKALKRIDAALSRASGDGRS